MPRKHGILSMEEFQKALKSHKLRATNQRIAVHEAMMELGHASADMVAAKIKEKGGASITVASVYNILSQLTFHGIYHYCMSAGSKMYFDVDTTNHLHLYDIYNDEFKDVQNDEGIVELVESKLKGHRFKGYKVDSVNVQIICHPSRKKNTITY